MPLFDIKRNMSIEMERNDQALQIDILSRIIIFISQMITPMTHYLYNIVSICMFLGSEIRASPSIDIGSGVMVVQRNSRVEGPSILFLDIFIRMEQKCSGISMEADMEKTL